MTALSPVTPGSFAHLQTVMQRFLQAEIPAAQTPGSMVPIAQGFVRQESLTRPPDPSEPSRRDSCTWNPCTVDSRIPIRPIDSQNTLLARTPLFC